MDLQLQELLDRIHTEGVDAANKKAADISARAEQEAAAILANAEKNAAAAEAQARARIASMEEASRTALVQASRDTMIGLRAKIQIFIENILKSDIAEAFSPALLASILPELLKNAAKDTTGDLEVLLPPAMLRTLDQSLAARLGAELYRGISFRPFAGVDAGFRISAEKGAVQLDYSADAVAKILASRVNARVGECLAAAVKAP